MAEVVELYFEDSAGKLEKLQQKLAATVPDFNEVDQLVHQFKGSSASFGAQSLAGLCVQVMKASVTTVQGWPGPASRPDQRSCSGVLGTEYTSHPSRRSNNCVHMQLRDACMRGDQQGCQALLQEVKRSFGILKGRLEIFMQLETQRKQVLASM